MMDDAVLYKNINQCNHGDFGECCDYILVDIWIYIYKVVSVNPPNM